MTGTSAVLGADVEDTGPPPLQAAKRPRKSKLFAPGAFALDMRRGCGCCGSWLCEVNPSQSGILGEAAKIKCRPEVLALRSKIVDDRRHFHRFPEVGFQEIKTAAYCAERLRSLGLEVEEGVAPGTGVVAYLKGEAGVGPCVLLRADMDALPIQEEPAPGEDELPFASENAGVMHACGHDAHMAVMLCVAQVLSDPSFRCRLTGSIKFVFQPAEETANADHPYGGAYEMVHRARILDGVDYAFGMHVWSFTPIGVVGVSEGCVMASCDTIHIDIEGQGGHGAVPQGTVDSVLVMGHLITALHSIVSRNHDPMSSVVFTIGSAMAGNAPNVIASHAKLSGTVRCLDRPSQSTMKRRIEEVCEGVGKTFGARINLTYNEESPPVVNDSVGVQYVRKAAEAVAPVCQRITTMAAEDFAFFLEGASSFPAVTVPGIKGCFFFVGAAPKAEEAGKRPHHNPAFTIDEDALLVGASVFVQLVDDLLGLSRDR